jgi:hypothetical protein
VPAVGVTERIFMAMLGEQSFAALVEGEDLVEGRVDCGLQGRGAKKCSHPGELLIVNFNQPLRHGT